MKRATFSRAMVADAKRDGVPLVRLQYDCRHVDEHGIGVEAVGPAPAWVVDAIDDILERWRNEDERSETLH